MCWFKNYHKGFETVNTSSPSFLKIIKKLGGKYEIKKNHKFVVAADGAQQVEKQQVLE